MNSVFGRALIGFTVLTIAIALLTTVALWLVETFAGGVPAVRIVVGCTALIIEVMLYGDTLHGSVRQWIKEPEEAREERSLFSFQGDEMRRIANEEIDKAIKKDSVVDP